MRSQIQRNIIHTGDALHVLQTLPENSVDAIVCDPPCGISFMNLTFDSDRGGRDHWIAWLSRIMNAAKRVLRPGGYALVWSLPRTSHWTGLALEQAGFEVRDCLYHLYSPDTKIAAFLASLTPEQRALFVEIMESQETPQGILHIFSTGFPKSLDVSKSIDQLLGQERSLGEREWRGGQRSTGILGKNHGTQSRTIFDVPASSEAAKHHGYGTALKPACEHWWLCRKPLSESNVAANVLKWGTGGLNIAACRVGNEHRSNQGMSSLGVMHDDDWQPKDVTTTVNGRWPSHLLLSHSSDCESGACVPGCPVRELDEQSGTRKSGGGIKTKIGTIKGNGITHGHFVSSFESSPVEPSEGGASRFFTQFYYCPKASRSERSKGLDKAVTLRANLTEEQKSWVLAELEKAGVRTHE